MKRVYIDGQHGTAGLKLSKLLEEHPYVELLSIDSDKKREKAVRLSLMESADLVVFCLPQSSVKDAIKEVPEGKKVIDCSNAFRCDKAWTYGLPELGVKQRQLIQNSIKVSNPGCFATAFILLAKPLIENNFIDTESIISISAVNGYSAGGARMVKLYEENGFRGQVHGLNQNHRHLPEMVEFCGLKNPPFFIPIVGSHKEGLVLSFPVNGFERDKVLSCFHQIYENEKFINVIDSQADKLSPVCEAVHFMDIYLTGTDKRLIVTAKMNNLHKGAASNLVQNLNLMLGFEECTGL